MYRGLLRPVHHHKHNPLHLPAQCLQFQPHHWVTPWTLAWWNAPLMFCDRPKNCIRWRIGALSPLLPYFQSWKQGLTKGQWYSNSKPFWQCSFGCWSSVCIRRTHWHSSLLRMDGWDYHRWALRLCEGSTFIFLFEVLQRNGFRSYLLFDPWTLLDCLDSLHLQYSLSWSVWGLFVGWMFMNPGVDSCNHRWIFNMLWNLGLTMWIPGIRV